MKPSSKAPRSRGWRASATQSSTTRRVGRENFFPSGRTTEKGCGGLGAAVSANNATTQREGNVQKMHIALKRPDYRQGCCPVVDGNGARNATVQMDRWPGNCFRKGNSWVLSYRCG